MAHSEDEASGPQEVITPENVDLDPLANTIVEVLKNDIENGVSSEQPPSPTLDPKTETPPFTARRYQLEMLGESLKKNIIVAMDTGSGKTHVAVLRMLHELEHISSNQMIWFLAPTVALCTQQYEDILSKISSVQVKMLSGADGVDRSYDQRSGTEQSLWDSVLENVRIVVCTYQILLDALTHGFVKMESISLIVFDEAHNCVRKHAGSKIMTLFYHPRKTKGLSVPSILGLTASPVMSSNTTSLGKIEETLGSICRTPTKYRSELRRQVNLPVLSQIYYKSMPSADSLTMHTKVLESLSKAYSRLDFERDPYVLHLRKNSTEKGQRALRTVMLNHKTWCQEQMKSFYATSLKVCHDLGGWAADYYISQVITNYLKIANEDEYLGGGDVSAAERKYLAASLRTVEINRTTNEALFDTTSVSDKVSKLIEALIVEPTGLFGIIFVQERAMVAVLYLMLTLHPSTRGKFRMGIMVGTSTSPKRTRNISEMLDVKSQKDTLTLFKSGAINLVVATSVLEEGIDVPSCNLVLCFQKPANLKSFVQRRGRARHQNSKLILMFDSAGDTNLSEWQQLETDMRAIYENEMRELAEYSKIEDSEKTGSRQFHVESTGAMLDLDNAIPHLYHFCATLPKTEYVDTRPEFICSEAGHRLFRAQVILPLSVDETVRYAKGQTDWASQKNAMKDAAFEAYVALYKAGLINENLLPLRRDPIDEPLSDMEKRASIMVVNEQLVPWVDVAIMWQGASQAQRYAVHFNNLDISMLLPISIPPIPGFSVYWDSWTEFPITINNNAEDSPIPYMAVSKARDETQALLEASFGSRFSIKNDFPVVLFSTNEDVPVQNQLNHRPADEIEFQHRDNYGIVREISTNRLLIFKEWLSEKPAIESVQDPYDNYGEQYNNISHLSLVRLPKRQDFLHRVSSTNTSRTDKKIHSIVLPLTACTIDDLDFKYLQFGLMIPSIMRRLEVYMLASKLSTTVLKNVQINNLDLIVTAICASSAQEISNYQRLEFIGDSVLKLCTSVQIMADNPLWHEGYLSSKKDRLVSNARLSRAAVDTGLDKYIITKSFTGYKWRPLYVPDLLKDSSSSKTREMSSKVLADVVEALIGASLLSGGIPAALSLLRTFLPEQDWLSLETRQLSLFNRVRDVNLPITLQPLEGMLGYEFKKKGLLIEAVTHASYITGSGSLERIEFLGDSILESIVVDALRAHEPELSHWEMHHLRTVLVNADFLAFLCMEFSCSQESINLKELPTSPTSEKGGKAVFEKEIKTTKMPLWKFLRHHSPALAEVQVLTTARHAELREGILEELKGGKMYPWAKLASLLAMKWYSDVVESIIGALWIDSGSFDVCRNFIENLGILPYLRRVLREGVDVWHPKERLGILAVEKRVKYTIESRTSVTAGSLGKEYLCKVEVGEEVVVRVEGGVSEEEVQTKAADAAVEILQSRLAQKGKDDETVVEAVEEDVDMVMTD